jgi:hypothetical protein
MPTYGKYRSRIFAKGLGNFTVLELSPTADTIFRNPGYLDNTALKDLVEVEVVKDENGNVILARENSQEARFLTNLKQTSIEEINLLRNAGGKLYAARYYGLTKDNVFQYFCIETGSITPGVELPYGKTARMLALNLLCHYLTDTRGFAVPLYHFIQTDGEINVDNLCLWLSPRIGYNALTAKVLDISGFARHGTLTAAFATIWQAAAAPERFLRFDGASDALSLGDILDDDGTTDFMMEVWAHIPAADGTLQEILGKKNFVADHSAGFALFRNDDNKVFFRLSDGDETANIVSTMTVLQNVWKHIAVAIDRNGNGQIYINGVASGAAVSVAALETAASNALPFYLGAVNGTEFGQVDISDVRVHRYASGLPADIATQILSHYTAERTIHGV